MSTVTPAVEIYAAPRGAVRSSSHRVRALGQAVFVERHSGVSYARFAARGSIDVEVEVDRAITHAAIFPMERVISTRTTRTTLTLEMSSPQSVVVWIDGLEKLFLLPDPLGADAPDPTAPDTFDLRAFGADPTGETLATSMIQAAVDAAAARGGGGTVLVAGGTYRTGTIILRSNVRLHLAAGTLLQGSSDPSDYPIDPGRHETAGDATLPPDVRYLGRTMSFSRLLLVDGAHDVRITGRGTIDGSGSALRKEHGAAPNLVRIRESRHVIIEDVLLRNAAAWSLHVLASSDVSIRNVKVINDRTNLNTDGIDPDMSFDVTIDSSFIHTKDDAICVKATHNSDLSGDVHRIRATNNLVSSLDAGLKVGTESDAGIFSEILFETNYVFDSGRAMSIVVRDGATYDAVSFRGIRVGPHVDHLVEQVIGVREPDSRHGTIRNLTFEDVVVPAFTKPRSNWTWYAQFRPSRPGPDSDVFVFEGADDAHAVDGLAFRRVFVNGHLLDDEAVARDVAGLTFGPFVRNVTLE